MALLQHKDYSDKSLFNAILLQLYGNKFTIESLITRGRHFMDQLIQKCPSRPQCHLADTGHLTNYASNLLTLS